ncbi:MAG: 2-C-methyl-D-erythritol 4-phosphate cytidylyltransferase, partial [Lachnospiraceae bacterium]|nr:2-C-methyl-D-erythritol 4-phosphate cytidylyltransferase [Lachnospiraceae bacterium]
MRKSYAVILAAGSGTRMGGTVAKQYQLLGDKPVLYYSIRAFEESEVDGIVLVTADGTQEYVKKEIVEKYGFRKVIAVAAGGEERMDSVLEGLRNLPGEGVVLVHDGARPFVTVELIRRLLARMESEAACIPAVPVKDTIKHVCGGIVADTPDRSSLFAVQTPQA